MATRPRARPDGPSPDGARRLTVRAHPRAARARAQWEGDVLHVWVTEPAARGRANQALAKAVATELGFRPSAVRLVSGERDRDKVFEITSGSRGRS